MCGVVGLIPAKSHQDIERELMDSLGLLLYRGYDSVGIAQSTDNGVIVTKMKATGIDEPQLRLYKKIPTDKSTVAAIGHSRWATHGPATDTNAHPHSNCTGDITLVHNGIIENVSEIQDYLAKEGDCSGDNHYVSDTDTEVVAHLIGHFRKEGLAFRESVQAALKKIQGSYAFLVLDKASPGTVIAVRLGSPLLLGVRTRSDDKNQHDIAVVSSAEPLANHGYSQVRALEDGDLVEITPGNYPETVRFYRAEKPQQSPKLSVLDVQASLSDKGENDTFFEKEIREQAEAARTVIHSHYVDGAWEARLGGFARWNMQQLKKIERVWLIAEGTSLHAAEVGAEWLRRYAELDATTKIASEFAANPGRIDPERTLHIVLSQSGETADVRIAAEEIVRQNGMIFGLVNVVGSSIARLVGEHGGGMYTHAGPEISVASTKVYTAQLSQLLVLTLFFARNVRGVMDVTEAEQWIKAHREIPEQIEQTMSTWESIKSWAPQIAKASKGILYIGRGPNLPTAREGSLKLRELSYLNAVAYSAGEMKHGTIALIDKDFPTIAIAPHDRYYEKMVGNIHEIKARGGTVFAVVTQADQEIFKLADKVVEIPKTRGAFTPILSVLPLQMLTHEVASMRGCTIDKPRNLAKSVTVT